MEVLSGSVPMRRLVLPSLALCAAQAASAQAALRPVLPPGNPTPSLEETRAAMGIPSQGDLRGQRETLAFASRAEQMARVWEAAAAGPAPEPLGPKPAPGVAGIICPHDDYLCTARVYREIIPLVTARTVVLAGVYHKHRRYGAREVMVFDPYRAWRSPDGEIPVSSIRGEVLARLDPSGYVQDAAGHDSEHSLEAIAYWLKHQTPGLEILPVILPSAGFPRLRAMASDLAAALAAAMRQRGWALGRDLAIVISSDGMHYGEGYQYVPYGPGGVDALDQALAFDRQLIATLLAGTVTLDKAQAFHATMVDPEHPDTYRRAWCGRFSIPFGLVLLLETARNLGLEPPRGMPVALGCSVTTPEIPLREMGLGLTAPVNLYHFVTAPAIAFA